MHSAQNIAGRAGAIMLLLHSYCSTQPFAYLQLCAAFENRYDGSYISVCGQHGCLRKFQNYWTTYICADGIHDFLQSASADAILQNF